MSPTTMLSGNSTSRSFLLLIAAVTLGCGADDSELPLGSYGGAGAAAGTEASGGKHGGSQEGGNSSTSKGLTDNSSEGGAAGREAQGSGAGGDSDTEGPHRSSSSGGSGAGGAPDPGGPDGSSGEGGIHEPAGGGTGGTGAEGAASGGGTDAGSTGEPGSGGTGGTTTDPDPPIQPVLDALEVTNVQVPLKPSYNPERDHYSFVPNSSGAVPALVASAAEGLVIQVNGTTVSSGEPISLPRDLEGTRVEILVSNSSGISQSYDVQYLPAGFPDIRVTINEPGASRDPIYVTLRRGNSSTSSFVTKFDNAGVPLYYVSETIDTYDFKKHLGGFVSYARGRTATEHRVLDEQFNELNRVKTVGLVNTDIHEFHILPNGNQILLAYEPAERDLTAYGGSGPLVVQDAVVQEVSSSGAVLFQWNSWGQLPYDESLYPSATDYAHVNSVSLAEHGDWLISVRGFSQVIKVEPETGTILWRLGGIASEFTILDDPLNGFCGQHTASQLDNGNLLVFDNGLLCWPENPARGEHSRVAEYEIDEVAKTARLVWSYARPGTYVAAQGSAQRLPNGNTFIGWGSNTSVLASEVDPAGNVVFEVQAAASRGSFVSYRAWRFPD